MLTWMICPFVHIQRLRVFVCALLLHIIRDCGEDINLIDTPRQGDLHLQTGRSFEDAQADVLADWQLEQREKFNADFLESLKKRYEIVIDEIPAERILIRPDEIADTASP